MEMHQVRYFIAMCETLNFTRAAERCNITQPSLTRAIINLEQELGGPLFHRERNNTHLTELGQMMQPYLKQILSQVEAAKVRATAAARLTDVTLKIGVMCSLAPGVFSSFLHEFHAHNPGVELNVIDDSVGRLASMLAEGKIEVAIYGHPEGDDESFHLLPLFEERFVIVVSEGHPFCALATVRGDDLDGHDYVNRAHCEYNEFADRVLGERGIKQKRVFRSERDGWVEGMIAAGLGYGLFPQSLVANPALIVRPLVEPEFIRTLNLVTARGRPHSPAVGAFVREARSHEWLH